MKRSVRFAADVKVHMIDGEENRRGVWEQYARDRERFQRRIQTFESIFQPVIKEQSKQTTSQLEESQATARCV